MIFPREIADRDSGGVKYHYEVPGGTINITERVNFSREVWTSSGVELTHAQQRFFIEAHEAYLARRRLDRHERSGA